MSFHIHFVGVKGTGVSALAQVSAQVEGATVTGSDVPECFFTDSLLERAQIPVLEFSAENVEGADLVVASAAYTDSHVEIARARELNIPVLSYPQYLGRLFSKKRGIAVSGTHGKSTTTAMIGSIMLEAGLDPTIVVGTYVPGIGGNAHAGQGEFFLAESCEYRRHFLNYSPEYLIITNIELDHPDYFKDIEDVGAAFAEFAEKVPQSGKIFAWSEDPNRKYIRGRAPVMTFGFSEQADVRATNISFHNNGSSMEVFIHGTYAGDLELQVSGKHNILDALAATAFCYEVGIPVTEIFAILNTFCGTKRRFEHIGVRDGAIIVDDYAHHPTEIRSTLEGARLSFPERRIRAIFQPHTYSRTEKLLEDFSQAFKVADEVVVAEIFASAREQGQYSVSASVLAEMINQQGVEARYIGPLEDIKSYLSQTLAPQDLVLTLGAGDIYKVGEGLV